MNKRILELAKQAGVIAQSETAVAPPMEKFVELIVKKCMDVAKYHTPDTEESEYTWLIHDKIKQHFGVEE